MTDVLARRADHVADEGAVSDQSLNGIAVESLKSILIVNSPMNGGHTVEAQATSVEQRSFASNDSLRFPTTAR